MGKMSVREFIVMSWERLHTRQVGRKELRAIQNALAKEFGVAQSPASIARLLSDAGAELKHPEIIEFDAKWREAQIEKDEARFKSVNALLSDPLSIERSEALIREMELLRLRFAEDDDREGLQRLKTIAIETRRLALSAGKDQKIDKMLRREQKEIAEWLTVWLQTPKLFEQWLELRKRSPEFGKIFER
ncbi:MAG: hypothetical protein DMF72_07370 [Acidobacteria bacterium]|nr:MAG: hypothetical protein DMF72_07370 [Acidobacteriota bacterium]